VQICLACYRQKRIFWGEDFGEDVYQSPDYMQLMGTAKLCTVICVRRLWDKDR